MGKKKKYPDGKIVTEIIAPDERTIALYLLDKCKKRECERTLVAVRMNSNTVYLIPSERDVGEWMEAKKNAKKARSNEPDDSLVLFFAEEWDTV